MYTEKDIEHFEDLDQWHHLEVTVFAAAIAGLFHDFGKATILFQKKLDPNQKTKRYEPYRHEWVSLRLFQGFVGDKNDHQWLDALSDVKPERSPEVFRDGLDGGVSDNHPLCLPSFAKLVAWLILTHHKLPLYPGGKSNPPQLECVDNWLTRNFEALWNSHNCKDEDMEMLEQNWDITKGIPFKSAQWRSKACVLASRAKRSLANFLQGEFDWLHGHIFTAHLSRLCLMLADHHYSAQETVTEEWRNPGYEVYANTEPKTKRFKQKLDEHLIGVAHHSEKIVRALPTLNRSLPSLGKNSFLGKDVDPAMKIKFGWQDEARIQARELGGESIKSGFFGINMASTGKGKTLGNAKIMYSLGKQTGRTRFCIALGLRTLTLQTGREFQDKMDLGDKELAIAVGGIAVRQLFEAEQMGNSDESINLAANDEEDSTGSESRKNILDPDLFIDYGDDLPNHSLSQWTEKNEKLERLVCAPVLVSTIDHLMPATEGTKGGKQIAPMLRLLTSDLVLDEPDDFGLKDLPALCRLVHWAGMLGSRILLSSATIPPSLVYALFKAYREGWKHFASANFNDWNQNIVCAWFDEFLPFKKNGHHPDFDAFKESHENFIKRRVKHLKETSTQRKGRILPVEMRGDETIIASMARTIREGLLSLHCQHHQSQGKFKISLGLVRMANINPLVAIAKEMLSLDAPEDTDTCLHYCVYHSRYPLAVRHHIESKLDKILKRRNPEDVWSEGSIKNSLADPQITNHIFVVIASPVAEVGRDHDYDWAIVEPSSMRSIIQLAGRVLRHRDHIPASPNVLLLNKNYKVLSGSRICFLKPGFESEDLQVSSHDLKDVLEPIQYQEINSIQRITLPKTCRKQNQKFVNLVELEHKALAHNLFSTKDAAKVWWTSFPHWCGEVQRQQRFRDSMSDEAYYLWIKDHTSSPFWQWKNERVSPTEFGEGKIQINTIDDKAIKFGKRNLFWFDLKIENVYSELASNFDLELDEVSRRFGEVRLIEYGPSEEHYEFHPNLGIYKNLGNENG